MSAFVRYIGIDYSGAQTPTASLKGLRVYMADQSSSPVEVLPSPSPRKYWTRRGIAEWLVERLTEDTPALVGIDHGFSFPLRYFDRHGLKPDWHTFLDDFQRHWPTDENIYVDFVRDGAVGNGVARMGNARWRRLTEERVGGAKSLFHFDVQGSVAKSTHAGIPWLRFIRQRVGERVHFWPFDGWVIPAGRSAITEVYPALWSRSFARADRTADQHQNAPWQRWRDGYWGWREPGSCRLVRLCRGTLHAADLMQLVLQTQLIERSQRQGCEYPDALMQHAIGILER